jgi:hypothetical protein
MKESEQTMIKPIALGLLLALLYSFVLVTCTPAAVSQELDNRLHPAGTTVELEGLLCIAPGFIKEILLAKSDESVMSRLEEHITVGNCMFHSGPGKILAYTEMFQVDGDDVWMGELEVDGKIRYSFRALKTRPSL